MIRWLLLTLLLATCTLGAPKETPEQFAIAAKRLHDQGIFKNTVFLAAQFLGKMKTNKPQFTGLLPDIKGKGMGKFVLQGNVPVEFPPGKFFRGLLNGSLLIV